MCRSRLTLVIDFEDGTQALRELIAKLEKEESDNDLETAHVTTEDIAHAWCNAQVAGRVHHSEIYDMA